MKLTSATFAGAALAAALACAATAETRVNDNLSFFGYVVGSVQCSDVSTAYTEKFNDPYMLEEGEYSARMDDTDWVTGMDAILVGARMNFGKVSGVVSVCSRGSSFSEGYFSAGQVGAYEAGNGSGYQNDPVILDAYCTYDAGNGVLVKAGNFQSSLGYEPFHIIGSNAISAGAGMCANLIPAYSTGMGVTVERGAWTGGVAVKDSIYSDMYFKGDGELNEGAGAEAFVKFRQDALTVFLGMAYDNGEGYDTITGDIWAEFVINATTLAAEFCYKDMGMSPYMDGDTWFWLVSARQAMGRRWALAVRISGGQNNTDYSMFYGEGMEHYRYDNDFLKGTIAATCSLTENLEVVVEYSCTDQGSDWRFPTWWSVKIDGTAHFGGVQFRFHY